jgi:hypothetical protein
LCDFETGDVVKCIDDTPVRAETQIMPELGALYIVESVRPVGDGHSVRLREMKPSCHLGGVCAYGGCGWDAARFKRVYRPKPGLKAMLLWDVPETV